MPGKYGRYRWVVPGTTGPISEPYYPGAVVLLGALVEWAAGVGLEEALSTGAMLMVPIAAAANNGAMDVIVFFMVGPLFVRSARSVIRIVAPSRTGVVVAEADSGC